MPSECRKWVGLTQCQFGTSLLLRDGSRLTSCGSRFSGCFSGIWKRCQDDRCGGSGRALRSQILNVQALHHLPRKQAQSAFQGPFGSTCSFHCRTAHSLSVGLPSHISHVPYAQFQAPKIILLTCRPGGFRHAPPRHAPPWSATSMRRRCFCNPSTGTWTSCCTMRPTGRWVVRPTADFHSQRVIN